MHTNGANGHQHEASEKKPAPDIFTTRVDMEVCACGAMRWVDQDGAPATPWQSINLGTKPGGNEGARAALRTPPKSALDGLITCGSCGQPMILDDTGGEQEAHYVCQPGPGNLWAQCQTPRLHALRAEVLLVRTALQTVLTEENIYRVLAEANDPQRYDAARERSLTRKDVQELGENPERLVLAADSTRESRDFLGRLVAEIQVYTRTAVICYALPLPGDSPLAGMPRQEVDLPGEVLRTIAKSGSACVEAVYGLRWAEGASLRSQEHGHAGWKPSFQAQRVQPSVDQDGEDLTQPRTAQRVDVLIPTAVPGCPRGRLFT